MKKLLLMMVVVLGINGFVNAQVSSKENLTLKDEKARIAAGVNNGTITKSEAKRLRKEAKDVKRAKKRACGNDGRISKKEKKAIAIQDAQLDKAIRKSKTN
jgi:hypothetical protein